MTKYRVYLQTGASVAVTVEVADDLPEDEAREQAIEKAFDEAPSSSLCIHCSGYGQEWSRDLGDLELERDNDGREAMPEKVS
uniref:hypothetical protein n=1 Tax=Paractinoplanes polyasparticus TaxID=2856853 RepID=UPI001C861850|nr:hypothetical protein [Actinoplanes polyasparticus]